MGNHLKHFSDIKLFNEVSYDDYYKVHTYFFICAFLGWIFETAEIYIRTGVLESRGFLFIGKELSHYIPFLANIPLVNSLHLVWGLPIILIYGFGGVLVIRYLDGSKHKIYQVFLIGMVSMTLVELLGSYFTTEILHKEYWDYSHDILNFQGRICLRASIAWGVLTLFAVYIISPFVKHTYENLKAEKNYKLVIHILVIYTLICSVVKYGGFIS